MTYDKPTSDPPAGPTPEEISARLEALLKRTHELRRAQAKPRSGGQPDEGPTWPPSDRDMAAVEVVDVPASTAARQIPGAATAGTAALLHVTSSSAESAARPASTGEHPEWNALRLRNAAPAEPTTKMPGWVWPVIAVLVLALALETAYLLWTAPWAVAPVAAVTAAAPPAEPSAVPQDETPQPASASREMTTDTPPLETSGVAPAPSATTGAVRIESDPPGAIVTMEGRERGVTPLTIDRLRPGRHDVIVDLPGQRRLDLKVDITAGQTTRLDASGRPPAQR